MVLVVDDTKNIRNLLTACLESCGYEVMTAANGHEAIEIAREYMKDIELLFLDIKMPEMNGTEVLKSVRRMGIDCPVIIMTAFATIKNAVDCTKLGAVAYLQKPFTTERVKNILNEVLEEKSYEPQETSEEDSGIYASQGRKLIEQGRIEEALKKLRMALSIDSSNPEVYLLLGKANEAIGDTEKANKYYKAAEIFAEKDKNV